MSHLTAALLRIPKPYTILMALVLAALIGWMDYATGFELRLTAVYLIPIGWACWAVGYKAGLFLAVVSTVICRVADVMLGHTFEHDWIPIWNAGAIFLVAVLGLSAFLNAHRSLLKAHSLLENVNERLEETVQQRTAALKTEVAEREQMEKAKLEAERLLDRQEKLAVLGTLTAGIAHEIRNPLTSLKARLYTLQKHLHTVPAARKDTDIISAEISRLERILKDALSFARPAEPELEIIAAETLFHDVERLMFTSLEDRGVNLVVEANPELLIRADSGHLKQVLINLVYNAADAIEGHGTITLRTRAAEVVLNGREIAGVILEVNDTGKGITSEVEKRLFDPYFSTKETGTGLGLPIAARIVEKHGGRLEYQTRLDHGTTFAVVLPRAINKMVGSV